MSLNPKFYGNVTEGKLTFEDKDSFYRYINNLDGRVEIVVKKFFDSRSQRQNRYYWAVVIDTIAKSTGHTPTEVHDYMRQRFLTEYDDNSPIPKVKSTTDLNTAGFVEYVTNIVRWASSDMGIYIPEPHETDWK